MQQPLNSFDSKCKVAVLMAAFNGIKWIEEQIYSIFNQEKVNIDLFISVDTSTDGTYEYCKSIEKKNQTHQKGGLDFFCYAIQHNMLRSVLTLNCRF